MTKSILFCGYGSSEAISAIKEMGYVVYLITDFPDEPGTENADFVVKASCKDPEEALSAAKQLWNKGFKFDGVTDLCVEAAISVAVIADFFNLRGIGVDVARNSAFKSLRARLFRDNEIPSAKFCVAFNEQELDQSVQYIGFPLVLKPIDQSSAKGVILVEKALDLKPAYEHTKSFSSSKEVMIEEFLLGKEYSTEGLMLNGRLYPTAISDRLFKYEECKPYFIEIGDIMPTILPDFLIKEMFRLTEAAALTIGVTSGVVKGDLILCSGNSVKVLELAARLGGPRFGTEMVPLSNGTEILKASVQLAVGDPVNIDYLVPKFSRGMVNRAIFPQPGIIEAVEGLDKIKNLPGFYDIKWWSLKQPQKGDIVSPYKFLTSSLGYFIAYGESREEAIENADRIESCIKISTTILKN
jgi:biotin carboxylase